MYQIKFEHKVLPCGEVILKDYRYVNVNVPFDVMCELVNGQLVWYTEPDEFVKAVVEDEFIQVQKQWFLEFYGIKKIFDTPIATEDDFALLAANNLDDWSFAL